jgi:hypothetical protein
VLVSSAARQLASKATASHRRHARRARLTTKWSIRSRHASRGQLAPSHIVSVWIWLVVVYKETRRGGRKRLDRRCSFY